MHDQRDVAIVSLVITAVFGLTIVLLKVVEPAGGLVELLFPRF